MSDLAERLRGWMDMDAGDDRRTLEAFGALMRDAADRIEALEAALLEVSKLAGEYPAHPLAHTLRRLTGGPR